MPCQCGKRFIDEVFAHLYVILLEEGIFKGDEPLAAVGMPLIHPGFAMPRPPFLPVRSLVLVSPFMNLHSAVRITAEVPEIRGVVQSFPFTPGIVDPMLKGTPRTYKLLSGCDVRAGVFSTSAGPVVVYLQQSLLHIEFPRPVNPKIDAVEKKLLEKRIHLFIDATCGAGTLGLTAARHLVPYVILNDAWYASAFWAAFNLLVNDEFFSIDKVRFLTDYKSMQKHPIGHEPVKIAETVGIQRIEVYQGNLLQLSGIVHEKSALTVVDLFDKQDTVRMKQFLAKMRDNIPGDVFIP
jgi:hypothetical protein